MLHDLVAAARVDEHRRRALRFCLFSAIAAAAALLLHPFEQDIVVYHIYGLRLLHGSSQGHLPVEYPALSALAFAFPLVLPVPYAVGFVLLMWATLAVLFATARRLGADSAWLDRTTLYLGLGTVMIVFARYDLLPALSTLVAVLEARRRRWGPAWLAAIVGGALKLFPFLLLPGFFLAEWRERGRPPWRRGLSAAAVVAAYAGLQHVLAPGSLLSPIRFEWQRGFEYSSVGGSIMALIDPLHLRWVMAFNNHEVFGSGFSTIRTLLSLGAVVAILAIWALAWRHVLDVATVSLAVLSVAVLTDRAFAPQYLVWLAPLWALWPLRRSWVAAAALTTLTYPIGLALTAVDGHSFAPATFIAVARNVVLVAGTCAWFAERLKSGPRVTVGEGAMSDLVPAPPRDQRLTPGARLGRANALAGVVPEHSIEGGVPSALGGG